MGLLKRRRCSYHQLDPKSDWTNPLQTRQRYTLCTMHPRCSWSLVLSGNSCRPAEVWPHKSFRWKLPAKSDLQADPAKRPTKASCPPCWARAPCQTSDWVFVLCVGSSTRCFRPEEPSISLAPVCTGLGSWVKTEPRQLCSPTCQVCTISRLRDMAVELGTPASFTTTS